MVLLQLLKAGRGSDGTQGLSSLMPDPESRGALSVNIQDRQILSLAASLAYTVGVTADVPGKMSLSNLCHCWLASSLSYDVTSVLGMQGMLTYIECSCLSASTCFSVCMAAASCLWPRQYATSCLKSAEGSFSPAKQKQQDELCMQRLICSD